MSKQRTVLVGGLLINLTIKESKIQNINIGDYTYGPDDPIAKSFSSDFLNHMVSIDGRTPFNFNNPLNANDSNLKKMINKQESMLKRGISKHLKVLVSDDKIKNMKTLLSSGLITDEKLLSKVKGSLEKPRGLKGAMYNSMKAVLDFSIRKSVEKLKPEVDMKNYTTNSNMFVDDNAIESASEADKQINENQLFQATMMDFMKLMNENQRVMAESQQEFFTNMTKMQQEAKTNSVVKENNISEVARKVDKSAVEQVVEEKTETVVKEEVKIESKKEPKNVAKKAEKKTAGEIDFSSAEVKDDITDKWKQSRSENQSSSDPCLKYLNINTVKFNGISLTKLEKWKNNELSKENSKISPEIADNYIQKNVFYAQALKKMGILEENKDNEFTFVDASKKEFLYKNYDLDLNEINKLIDGKVKQTIKKNTFIDTNSNGKDKLVEYKNKFNDFAASNPSLVNEVDKQNFENYYNKLNNENQNTDVLIGEISIYVDGFIKSRQNKINQDALEVSDTEFDPNEDFAELARNSADLSVGGANLSEEDINSEEAQKLYDTKIAEALEENKNKEQKMGTDTTLNA